MENVKTYLEFGYQKGDRKVPYDIREDQEAYDFFMVSRYLKDVIGYRIGNLKLVHHKEDLEDNIKKYTALQICKNTPQGLIFYEVGSSLMGVIDALEYINKRLDKMRIKSILFIGVDNSDMMNHVASFIHPNYKLKLYKKIKKIKCDLFFAKGVSLLYAFDNEQYLCDVLRNAKIAIFDYTFSLRDSTKDFVGTGKNVTYLNIGKCKRLLDITGKALILKPSKREYSICENKVTYECIYGDAPIVDAYLKKIKKNIFLFRKNEGKN